MALLSIGAARQGQLLCAALRQRLLRRGCSGS